MIIVCHLFKQSVKAPGLLVISNNILDVTCTAGVDECIKRLTSWVCLCIGVYVATNQTTWVQGLLYLFFKYVLFRVVKRVLLLRYLMYWPTIMPVVRILKLAIAAIGRTSINCWIITHFNAEHIARLLPKSKLRVSILDCLRELSMDCIPQPDGFVFSKTYPYVLKFQSVSLYGQPFLKFLEHFVTSSLQNDLEHWKATGTPYMWN